MALGTPATPQIVAGLASQLGALSNNIAVQQAAVTTIQNAIGQLQAVNASLTTPDPNATALLQAMTNDLALLSQAYVNGASGATTVTAQQMAAL
jgi:hypothetical protein